MFVESFHGQYKDETNGTRDFRMVSASFPLGARSHRVTEHAAICTLMDEAATITIWTGAIVLIVQDAVLKFSLLGWGWTEGSSRLLVG